MPFLSQRERKLRRYRGGCEFRGAGFSRGLNFLLELDS